MEWLFDALLDLSAWSAVERIPRRARWWVLALILVLPVVMLALTLRLLLS